MGMPSLNPEVISVEFFASHDPDGTLSGVMMAVPCLCGLSEANSLRIDGFVMLPMKDKRVLQIDLPDLDEGNLARLSALAASGQQLAVGEFTARGLLDSYFLSLTIVEAR